MSWSAVVAEGNLIPTAIAKNSTPAKVGSDKEQGDGGVPGDGAGGKLGLRESADVVRAGLKDFRQQRAAQVGRFGLSGLVLCASFLWLFACVGGFVGV